MQGIAKAVLITILVSICILLFVNLVFFFPWYMTLVTETFNLSQAAANDNYIKQSYYDDTLARLKDRPIFEDKAGDIVITVKNASGYTAVGNDYEEIYENESLIELDKPYRQRGKPITIEIEAVYPLSITLWGNKVEKEIPVSFSLTAVGLRHYKDLPIN